MTVEKTKLPQFCSHYASPLGELLLAADETGLTGLWFRDQKYAGSTLEPDAKQQEIPIFVQTKRWLDVYFSGQEPDFDIPLHLMGTEFQIRVWEILKTIPYGQTVTYGQIAAQLAPGMSAQAVGGAVGRNPVSVIVPCHRVLGSGGRLTGYAAGLDKKTALLKMEHIF